MINPSFAGVSKPSCHSITKGPVTLLAPAQQILPKKQHLSKKVASRDGALVKMRLVPPPPPPSSSSSSSAASVPVMDLSDYIAFPSSGDCAGSSTTSFDCSDPACMSCGQVSPFVEARDSPRTKTLKNLIWCNQTASSSSSSLTIDASSDLDYQGPLLTDQPSIQTSTRGLLPSKSISSIFDSKLNISDHHRRRRAAYSSSLSSTIYSGSLGLEHYDQLKKDFPASDPETAMDGDSPFPYLNSDNVDVESAIVQNIFACPCNNPFTNYHPFSHTCNCFSCNQIMAQLRSSNSTLMEEPEDGATLIMHRIESYESIDHDKSNNENIFGIKSPDLSIFMDNLDFLHIRPHSIQVSSDARKRPSGPRNNSQKTGKKGRPSKRSKQAESLSITDTITSTATILKEDDTAKLHAGHGSDFEEAAIRSEIPILPAPTASESSASMQVEKMDVDESGDGSTGVKSASLAEALTSMMKLTMLKPQ